MNKTKMLKKNYEFSQIFSKGKYYSGSVIEAFILKNRTNINYLGLAVSAKSGHAYQRNRIKRLLRENYKNYESQIIEGISIIFLLKKSTKIDEISFKQINYDIEKILKKAKIIIEKE